MALRKIIYADLLEIMVYSSEIQAGTAAAIEGGRRIVKILREKETCNIIFAAAVSQHVTLNVLSENQSIDWKRVNLFHMDEYIGLPKDSTKALSYFFSRYPKINPKNTYFFDTEAKDFDIECVRYEALLHQMPADIVICGVGDNGHLAFNEPHIANFCDPVWVKTVEIDDVSKQQQVNAGNFSNINSVPSLAYTITLSGLFAARSIICVAPTHYKAQAIKMLADGEITERCPATILRQHSDATLYTDSDSGQYLL